MIINKISTILGIFVLQAAISMQVFADAPGPDVDRWVVFTTSTTRVGNLGNQGDWDQQAQNLANAAGLSAYTFYALVSTDNTAGERMLTRSYGADSREHDVYNFNGDIIASRFNSGTNGFFLDGDNWDFAANYDENHQLITNDTRVWTGSDHLGGTDTLTEHIVGSVTGPGTVARYSLVQNIGEQTGVGGRFDANTATETNAYQFRAIAFVAASSAVPEPSTYLMLGSSLILVAYARSKNKKQAQI